MIKSPVHSLANGKDNTCSCNNTFDDKSFTVLKRRIQIFVGDSSYVAICLLTHRCKRISYKKEDYKVKRVTRKDRDNIKYNVYDVIHMRYSIIRKPDK